MDQYLKTLENTMRGVLNDPSKLHQFTDKSFLIMQHQLALDVRQKQMATMPIVMNFSVAAPKHFKSSQIQLCPQNCVDIDTLASNTDKVLEGKYFLCRTIAPPFKVTAISTIVEDPKGHKALRLSLYNYSEGDNPEAVLKDLPVGQIIALKNPWLKSSQDGGFSLRSDNPADVILFTEMTFPATFPTVKWKGSIPTQWQKYVKKQPQTELDWKNEGNQNFVAKEYQQAIQCYTNGLTVQESKVDFTLDLLSKRASAFTALRCFQRALQDLDELLGMDPNHVKGIYRKGKALCGLQKFLEAISFLENHLPRINSMDMLDLLYSARLQYRQQTLGDYDIPKLFTNGAARIEGIADYTGPVSVVSITGKGRGLVATKDIQAGELVIVNKAFAIVYPEAKNFEFNMNFQSKLINTGVQRILVQAIAQKISMEPTLARQVYPLFAGGQIPAWKDDDSTGQDLDMARIDAICTYNSFGGNILASCSGAGALDGLKDRKYSPLLQKDQSSGLWILPSYINHSCWDCNSTWHIYGDIILIRAFKKIKQGDEILVSYISPTETLKKREQYLKKHGFTCTCQLCQLDGDKTETGKKRIQIIEKILEKNVGSYRDKNFGELMKLFEQLERLEANWKIGGKKLQLNPAVIPALIDEALFNFDTASKSIEILLKCHAIAQNSVLNEFAVIASTNLIACYLMQSNVKQAKKWIKILRQDLILEHGTLEMANILAKDTLRLMGQFGLSI